MEDVSLGETFMFLYISLTEVRVVVATVSVWYTALISKQPRHTYR